MAIGINFLAKQQRKISKQKAKDLIAYRITLGIFGVAVVLSFLVVGSSFLLTYLGSQAQARQKELEESVLFQENIEESIVIVAKKLDILDDLLEKRQNKQNALDFFVNIFGSNVTLQEINYEADSDILSIRVQADSIFEYERITQRLESEETVSLFPDINISDLRRDADGTYALTVTVTLGEEQAS